MPLTSLTPRTLVPEASAFRLPGLADRVLINGRTGSGKTIGALWLLSKAPFDKQPYVIVDYKRDRSIAQIPKLRPLALKDKLPQDGGVYHLQPTPSEDALMDAWLWKVWEKTGVGLFFDEGYLVPPTDALRTIYTTGRSLHIPTNPLSQRPVGLPQWATSEADFHWVFHVRKQADRERIAQDTPFAANGRQFRQSEEDRDEELFNLDLRLPEFHSRWYDVGQDATIKLAPVPDLPMILSTFERRLTPRRRLI